MTPGRWISFLVTTLVFDAKTKSYVHSNSPGGLQNDQFPDQSLKCRYSIIHESSGFHAFTRLRADLWPSKCQINVVWSFSQWQHFHRRLLELVYLSLSRAQNFSLGVFVHKLFTKAKTGEPLISNPELRILYPKGTKMILVGENAPPQACVTFVTAAEESLVTRQESQRTQTMNFLVMRIVFMPWPRTKGMAGSCGRSWNVLFTKTSAKDNSLPFCAVLFCNTFAKFLHRGSAFQCTAKTGLDFSQILIDSYHLPLWV